MLHAGNTPAEREEIPAMSDPDFSGTVSLASSDDLSDSGQITRKPGRKRRPNAGRICSDSDTSAETVTKDAAKARKKKKPARRSGAKVKKKTRLRKASSDDDVDREPCPFDRLSDEIMLEIINRTDFWSRENLRATCVRMKRMIDGEVKKVVIHDEWVKETFKPRRFAYLRCGNKSSKIYVSPIERQIEKENLITQYVIRHPMLKTLHLHNSGMSLIHNQKVFQLEFAEKLANNCSNIEEILVAGSTGLRILLSYLSFMQQLNKEPKIKTIRLNPYHASGVLSTYLKQALKQCPHLDKIVIFATEYLGFTLTSLMKHEKKMIGFLTQANEHGIRSLVTWFRSEPSFKTSAIEKLSNLRELVLSGPYGSQNEYIAQDSPMTSINMQSIIDKNPCLRTLKIFLSSEACELLPKLGSLEKLILVLTSIDTRALHHVFSSRRAGLRVLGLTFLSKDLGGNSLQVNLSNCPSLEIFAVSFIDQTSVTALHILKMVCSAELRELQQIYYTNSTADILIDPQIDYWLERIFVSCRSLRSIYLNNRFYVRGSDRMVFKRGLVLDPRRSMESALFC